MGASFGPSIVSVLKASNGPLGPAWRRRGTDTDPIYSKPAPNYTLQYARGHRLISPAVWGVGKRCDRNDSQSLHARSELFIFRHWTMPQCRKIKTFGFQGCTFRCRARALYDTPKCCHLDFFNVDDLKCVV